MILPIKNIKMKYLVHTIILVVTFLFLTQSFAQQDPHFSLYKYNMNVVNPAYAGANNGLEAILGTRIQWDKIEGSPETYNFNVNSPISKGLGMGLSVVLDNIYVQSETHLYADFSYKIQLSKDVNLYAGLKAGGTFLNVDLIDLEVANDPLFSENINTFNPNFGVGLYVKAEDFFISLSAPSFLKNTRYKNQETTLASTGDKIHIFLGGGYDFYFRNRDWVFQPSMMMKRVTGAPISLDLTGAFLFRDTMEFGVNFRLDQSYTGFVTTGLMDDKLRIGYAFENTTSKIQKYGGPSHELVLKFSL